MAFFKWFARIEVLQQEDRERPQGALPPFDFAVLKPRTFRAKATSAFGGFAFQNIIPPILRVCQRWLPLPALSFLNLVIVTRDADVRAVLADSETFGVPYGPEMADLGDGTTFGLGLDGPGHKRQRDIMKQVMWRDDTGDAYFDGDLERVLAATDRFARALLENGAGRIDTIRDYITRIATETAALHFGLDIDDPDAFAEWSLAASCMLFGDPGGTRATRDVALNAAARLRLVLHKSIARAQQERTERSTAARRATILDRLVQLQHDRQHGPDPISDADITALLLGMVTGFVPTNTLAGAKMLAELLDRPDVLAKARDAAVTGNRDKVRAIIKECARFNSALAPGQWRVARKDGWIAEGAPHQRFVKQGTVLMVSTMTALRDPHRFADPGRFRIDRGIEGDLMFGSGPHACMGSGMAIEQITTMFMVLLAQPALQRAPGAAGRMEYTGVFPVRLDMIYEAPAATQSMFLVIVPVDPATGARAQVDALLGGLGNPAHDNVRALLNATGIVHFASLSTVSSSRGIDLIAELTVDGDVDDALVVIAQEAESKLRPIFALAGLAPDEPLAAFLQRHVQRIQSAPWGATGLNYNGTAEFSVRAKERQRVLAQVAENHLQTYLAREIGAGASPIQTLGHVRRAIKSAAEAVQPEQSAELDAFMLKPSRSSLKLADFRQPSMTEAFITFLKSGEGIVVTLPFALTMLAAIATLSQLLPPPPLLCWPSGESPLGWLNIGCAPVSAQWFIAVLWIWPVLIAGGVIAALAVVAILIGIAAVMLRRHERADIPDERQADLTTLEAIARAEDQPGYAQNHFMAVGELKAGLFRTLAHAFALWAIKMIIVFYYRPGFVINMGTIHAARWWRLPGTRTAIFYSNYDGSWESYLEDFITRVSWGQTAAWSNWVGFPETRYLVLKGAENGARFKRWVRTQQRIVPFWYSRFTDLTTDQIRTNALIHHGLARARTDTDAREWLRCFGSMPRVENRIETHEVQSIVFRGLGQLRYSTCLALTLPPVEGGELSAWLATITGHVPDAATTADPVDIRHSFPDAFVDPQSRRLNAYLCLTFGDHQAIGDDGTSTNTEAAIDDRRSALMRQHAAFFGCSATGFRKLVTHPDCHPALLDDLPGSFPPAFQMGMGKRHQILGDSGPASPTDWRWGDVDGTPTHADASGATEAVLMLYAATPAQLENIARFHTELIKHHKGNVGHRRDCEPTAMGPEYEHFGFRDGLSQPVIRGTGRVERGVPDRDLVAPGEFILGYADNQGYRPLSPSVRIEADRFGLLPLASDTSFSRYPDFGANPAADLPRDFGRNGSYMVIREITQDVEGFHAFADRKAAEITGMAKAGAGQHDYAELFRLAGQDPSADWIKAKMVGRWANGRPLIGNPTPSPHADRPETPGEISERTIARAMADQRAETENDFAYGTDDPQGFACPFGAHIRRTNPRDSKEPGDPIEQSITNRHRLLRRGRSYQHGTEKGLLFVALCSDIERQFEFVQQSWINAPGFHGLTNEPDPLIGTAHSTDRVFTIPTPSGPIKLTGMEQFTTVRGGGYFFLPSYSALKFMVRLTG